MYPACNAHAPYFHLWPARVYHIFPHYLINATVLERKVIEPEMCIWIFSTTFVRNISNSKKNWARCDHDVNRSSCRVPIILVIF